MASRLFACGEVFAHRFAQLSRSSRSVLSARAHEVGVQISRYRNHELTKFRAAFNVGLGHLESFVVWSAGQERQLVRVQFRAYTKYSDSSMHKYQNQKKYLNAMKFLVARSAISFQIY
jgi:hypothetical protein